MRRGQMVSAINRRGGTPSCEASSPGRTGRFQLEAAIQSGHAERARSDWTEWAAIMLFYEQLIRISPTLGTRSQCAAHLARPRIETASRGNLQDQQRSGVRREIGRHRGTVSQPIGARSGATAVREGKMPAKSHSDRLSVTDASVYPSEKIRTFSLAISILEINAGLKQ
jgi:hypothetical protein